MIKKIKIPKGVMILLSVIITYWVIISNPAYDPIVPLFLNMCAWGLLAFLINNLDKRGCKA